MFLRSCLRASSFLIYMCIYIYKWFHVSLMVGTTWCSSQRNITTSKLENHPQKPSKSIPRQCLKSSSGTSAPCVCFFRLPSVNQSNPQAGRVWLVEAIFEVSCGLHMTVVEVPKNWALEHMAKTGFIMIYIFDAIDKYTSH